MSIKVRSVAGENLTPGETAQDFVLNSHPVMMAPGTREFLELLQRGRSRRADAGVLLPVAPEGDAGRAGGAAEPDRATSTSPTGARRRTSTARVARSSTSRGRTPTPQARSAAPADRYLPARCADQSPRAFGRHLRFHDPVSDRQQDDADRGRVGRMERTGLAVHSRGAHPHSAADARLGGARDRLRAGRLQSLALPRRPSSARQLQPRAARHLPRDGGLSRRSRVKASSGTR